MPRRDEDFDDDDYLPPREQREKRSKGFPVVLIGGLIFGAIVVVLVALFAVRGQRAQQAMAVAREEAARAQQERAMQAVRGAPLGRPEPMPPPRHTWPRLIGVWARNPAGKDDTGYPYQFEFRQDATATTTRTNFDGNPIQQESTVEVMADDNNSARLLLHVPMGMYGFSFTLKPDGTIVLDDGKDGLVFHRVK